jgi:phosphocarrier protein HPr
VTTPRAAASVLLTDPTGLHARPAVRLTKLAKTFHARVRISTAADAGWVDAKSIVKVMALKIPGNTLLSIKAEGDDAETAVATLVALIERSFDEAATDPKTAAG